MAQHFHAIRANGDENMHTIGLSRRSFVTGLLAGAVGTGLRDASARSEEPKAPKETGLSREGLLAGKPGFQPRTVAPLPRAELPGFLSRGPLAAHHAEYARAVEALKAAEQALRSVDRSPAGAAAYGELRREQVSAANDVLLHELYFGNLAAEKVDLPKSLRPHMHEHMGSLQSWAADFTDCASAAKRWAALVYDPYDDRWHDTVMDRDTDGVWVGGNPLVVCDVAEHAYEKDYKHRGDYVAKFLERIDWNEVARRYEAVDRM